MSVDKFKFVSPGVFIDEIDESAVPTLPERMGPLVIGRFQKGPANRPVRVDSFKDFVSLFGNPAAGNANGDIWRTGAMTAPTYAAYAVQAWLRNNSPCTVFRVLGDEAKNATDSNAAAKAGWNTDNSHGSLLSGKGGAFGLLIIPSGSKTTILTGTLGAVWYVQEGGVVLNGTRRSGATTTGSAGVWISSTAGTLEFKAKILDGSGQVAKSATFNFDRDSDQFIRKVFNTDPTKTNTDVTVSSLQEKYWLGETFESNLRNGENSKLKSGGTLVADATNYYGAIVALDGTLGAGLTWANHYQVAKASATGWFISQDLRGGETASFRPTSHTDKLFKIHALGGAGRAKDPGAGEASNRDFKISIIDIKPPTDKFNQFGTFTVLVRDSTDSDNKPVVLERFSDVNLNPNSLQYIGKVIGDRNYDYDDTNKVVREHGDNENLSKLVRVEVSDTVRDGGGKNKLPMGVYGPVVPATSALTSGSTQTTFADGQGSLAGETVHYPASTTDELIFYEAHTADGGMITASIEFPTTRLRVSSSEGDLVKANSAYFGYNSSIKGTKRFDQTNLDLLRGQPAALDPHALASDGSQYSWIFTLDDVVMTGSGGNENIGYYVSGSFYVLTGSETGFNKFTSPMFGGFDGFDVTEPDPLRNEYIADGATEASNNIYYSIKKAIDIASDSDFLEYDIATIPGITNTSLNTQLINACEDRGDALAIIDLKGNYQPPHENNKTETNRLGSVDDVVTNNKNLAINSSYGCTFYPFVKVRDTFSDSMLYVPPSVVALGTFSSSQRKSAVWFAPAGFTRGGLSEGSAGLPVIGVRQRLTSENRDKLYGANINPIASFPAEGIVIFGQKTLQVTPSALDRINVRRLLIFLKKEISTIASRILFDQNVQQTWDRFTGEVRPFLEGVKAGLGLTDFKIVLDNTTTTPDLVDRNILYAKIFLKPARAIEFIALDFIITRSGASFDD